ncbi:MAG: sigma-70 family RNA polymerase sigma factor, partial [Acidobacteria bacterium]|nr:sigma-70 family RNA polymerase sigma factor [Acidobacteriota bacterium]
MDGEALHELIGSYARFVVKIAARFRGYGLPMGDLVQEGNVGLMQGAMRFDPEREVRFSTYARWWIVASIQEYILRNSSIVRIGTTAAQKKLFFNLRRMRARIASNTTGPMTYENRRSIADQ